MGGYFWQQRDNGAPSVTTNVRSIIGFGLIGLILGTLLLTDYRRFGLLACVIVLTLLSRWYLAVHIPNRPRTRSLLMAGLIIVLVAFSAFLEIRLKASTPRTYVTFGGWTRTSHGRVRQAPIPLRATGCADPVIEFTESRDGGFFDELHCLPPQWQDPPGEEFPDDWWFDWTPIRNTEYPRPSGLALNLVGGRRAGYDQVDVRVLNLSRGAFYLPFSTRTFSLDLTGSGWEYKWSVGSEDEVGFAYIKQPYAIAAPLVGYLLAFRSVPLFLYAAVTAVLLFIANSVLKPLIAEWLKGIVKTKVFRKNS